MKHTKGKAKVHSNLKALILIGDNIELTQRIIDTKKIAKRQIEDIMEEGDANAERIVKAWNSHDELVSALQEITEGKGAFDMDPQQHANNTIRDMKEIAIKALKNVE